MMKNLLSVLMGAALLLSATPHLSAQGYPNQPINLVVPLAPGDAGDVAGRTMAEELARLLRVAVVPVNRPGASSTIGTDSVAKAKKDGYTILITNNTSVILSRILNPETTRYDAFKDLTPLGRASRSPMILAVRDDAAHKSFPEFIDHAKKNPGKIRVGVFGTGSLGHFATEIIKRLTGTEMTIVPFKGAAPAVTATLGGHVEAILVAVGSLGGHLKSGSLKGVVISSKLPEFPDIPTLAQLGYGQNFFGVWYSFWAPAGVSAEVTAVLVPAIEKVVKDPGVASKVAAVGIAQEYAPPKQVLTEMREEYGLMEEVAKKAGLVK
jgi:tripartite-type tricarboxylate transporter receptor subunit TctC